MTIRLGDLRELTRDLAYDVADTKANRLLHRWINAALTHVASLRDWSFYDTTDVVVVEARSSGTGLALTNGSAVATLTGEVFLPKHVSENYDLVVGGSLYKLVSISGDQKTAILDAPYQGTTDTGITYYLAKHEYELEHTPSSMEEVRDLDQYQRVDQVAARYFDRLRALYQSQTDSHAYKFAWRGSKFQIWPSPGDTGARLSVSYHRLPDKVSKTDDNDAEVDWDVRFQDLLERAIEVEVARFLGSNAQVSYDLALIGFNMAYARYAKVDNDTLQASKGAMGVQVPGEVRGHRLNRASADPQDI